MSAPRAEERVILTSQWSGSTSPLNIWTDGRARFERLGQVRIRDIGGKIGDVQFWLGEEWMGC
jgi:hypothetical protein